MRINLDETCLDQSMKDQTAYFTLELDPLRAEERCLDQCLHVHVAHSIQDCLPFRRGHWNWVSGGGGGGGGVKRDAGSPFK